jgi:hypothetical protein
VIASAALAACSSGSTNSVPVTPAVVVVAGEYAGAVQDSVAGAQSGDIVLAQHGTNVGGAMTLTSGATSEVESVALTLSGSSLTGSGVMDVNGAACTFAITGSVTNNTLTATYTGVNGCTRTGTWSLAQTCAGTAESANRRSQGIVPRC